MAFHWNWCSHVGIARPENQDYAGIALGEDFIFAVVADGVFSRPRSGKLAQDLVSTLVDCAAAKNRIPESSDVLQWTEDAFQKLKRDREPKSSTSFLAAVFVREQLLFSVHAGDCRAGVLDSNLDVEWKTPVHSVATAIKTLSEAEICSHPARNQLTRTFGTKRFCIPEVIRLGCDYKNGAILATDGYWAEIPKNLQKIIFSSDRQEKYDFKDDVSRLSIQWDESPTIETAEQENLYTKKFPIKTVRL
jgi:serine/threonine protein phosphatase PrpC